MEAHLKVQCPIYILVLTYTGSVWDMAVKSCRCLLPSPMLQLHQELPFILPVTEPCHCLTAVNEQHKVLLS